MSTGGISFVNYADYMDIKTLAKVSGSGTVSATIGTVTNQLSTRQLSDSVRIQISGRTGDACTFSFDVAPRTAPNEFGQSITDLRNVGCFGLFGIVPVQFNNQTTYPQPAILGATAVLKAYSNSAPGTGLNFTSPTVYVGELSYQGVNVATSMPNSVFARTPANAFTVLDNAASLIDYPGQGWGGQSIGAKPRSFRVEVSLPPDTGTTIIELGRLWIGNAFRPAGGVSDVSFGIYDPSQLTMSRDNQAYPSYFNRAKTMSMSFPVLTELEALGVGTSPRELDSGLDLDFASANCYMQAMYSIGVTKECVAWALDYPAVATGGQAAALLMSRTALYGHASKWADLQWMKARKSTQGGQTNRRVWTGGVSLIEER